MMQRYGFFMDIEFNIERNSTDCIYKETTRELWCDLQECYLQTNAPQFFQVQKEIGDLVQDDLTASAYFTHLKTLWDESMNYMTFP